MQRADVRMIERRHRACLALEALAELGRGHLDGNRPVEPRVLRLVDLTHAAGPERGEDFVGAKSRAVRQDHLAVSPDRISGVRLARLI